MAKSVFEIENTTSQTTTTEEIDNLTKKLNISFEAASLLIWGLRCQDRPGYTELGIPDVTFKKIMASTDKPKEEVLDWLNELRFKGLCRKGWPTTPGQVEDKSFFVYEFSSRPLREWVRTKRLAKMV